MSSSADFDSTGPLGGLRIVDISTYVAGPSAGMTLAQLGADVIRVDRIGGAADTLRLPVDVKGQSLYWAGLNRGKRSIEIDTSFPEGRELVARLLAVPGPEGGILLTNAVAQGWLAYEALAEARADLIEVQILGHGDGRPAVDYTVNCEVGLPLITGPADSDRPVNHVLPAWDLLTGLHACLAIMGAERVRARTGRGQLVTVSLADVAVATMANLGFVADVILNGIERVRDGNYLYGSFGCDFQTSDGRWVMLVALTERHWRKLVDTTGIGEAVGALERALHVNLSAEENRYRYRELLAALIRPWFDRRSYEEVASALEVSQVLWGPYRTVEEFVIDPASILRSSDLMADVEHPGIGTYPTPGSVLRFAGSSRLPPAAAPVLGDDTDPVLGELLGMGLREIADLRAKGLVGGSWR